MDKGLTMDIMKYFTLTLIIILPALASGNNKLPDPTRPPSYLDEDDEFEIVEVFETRQKIKWKLSAIRISEKGKSAIVNGKLVREGDVVGPAKVLEIRPLSVVVDHEDRKLVVRLFSNQVKKDYKNQE